MASSAGAIPKTAKALVLRAVGSVDGFAIEQVPVVLPKADEVLVKVKGCAVAYRDTLDRQGAFKFIQLPAVLGHEFSGTVVAAGPSSSFKEGDEVVSLHWNQWKAWPSPLRNVEQNSMFGLSCAGGYAQYATAPGGCFAPAPKASAMSLLEAACVMSTFGTVWQGAKARGGMCGKDHVLVTGASGGVGTAAVKLAKAMGCATTAVTTSEDKTAFLKEALGCDEVAVARPHTSGKKGAEGTYDFKLPKGRAPADLVLEAVGGPTFTSSLRALTPGGRIVLVGNVENSTVPLPLGLCILNSIAVIGSDSIQRDAMAAELYPFMAQHGLKPEISRVVGLADIPSVHQGLEARKANGRCVVDMDLLE